MASESKSRNLEETRHIESLMKSNQEDGPALESSIPVDEIAFPDGGCKAWLTLFGGWLTIIASAGFLNGLAVFQTYYSTTQLPSYSPSDIAWIGSLSIWGCFFFGMWAGQLSDKYGPKVPLATGSSLIVFGTMMASISTEFYQFVLSQGICIGIGCGLVFTPAIAIQSQWFLKKRGFAVGLVMSAQNVGGVIWPIVVNNLLNTDGVSLGWTLRAIGFIQLPILVAATFLVQTRFPRNMPREPVAVRSYFTDLRTVLFTLSSFTFFLGVYVPYFYITSYGLNSGASAKCAFYLSAILNAAGFFGCYIFGIAADTRLGHFISLTAVSCSCAIAAFGWIGAHNNAGTIVWTIFYGFLSGGVQALFSPCLSLLAPSPQLIGTWNGLLMTVVSFPIIGTGPIAGQLLNDAGGTDYLPMQLFTAVCLTAASALYLLTLVIYRSGKV